VKSLDGVRSSYHTSDFSSHVMAHFETSQHVTKQELNIDVRPAAAGSSTLVELESAFSYGGDNLYRTTAWLYMDREQAKRLAHAILDSL
jgi:hypothetical protein